LGDRVDTYRMMQRALKEAGIERGGAQLTVFERGRRETPVLGKVIAVGLVDEITDRQYVIVDGTDGRGRNALATAQCDLFASRVRIARVRCL
jgi:type IV secretory pathway VirD2 relaxase